MTRVSFVCLCVSTLLTRNILRINININSNFWKGRSGFQTKLGLDNNRIIELPNEFFFYPKQVPLSASLPRRYAHTQNINMTMDRQPRPQTLIIRHHPSEIYWGGNRHLVKGPTNSRAIKEGIKIDNKPEQTRSFGTQCCISMAMLEWFYISINCCIV